jgi:membrane protein DedA with SNARE-associated domain
VLAFIDEIVIPFLNSLYGAVGYVGVMLAMAIESAMVPLPSELILPYAGFLVLDTSQIEPLTGQPWNFLVVAIVATIGNTLGRSWHMRSGRTAAVRSSSATASTC